MTNLFKGLLFLPLLLLISSTVATFQNHLSDDAYPDTNVRGGNSFGDGETVLETYHEGMVGTQGKSDGQSELPMELSDDTLSDDDEKDEVVNQPIIPTKNFKTKYKGQWYLETENVGVAAMQLQLMPNNKVVWFDTTFLGDSARKLEPPGNCPMSFEKNKPDCFAHALAYDAETGESRPIQMMGDPWCSSGGLTPNGQLLVTGGANKGIRSVRLLDQCEGCNFEERPQALGDDRWYASNQVLEDGSQVVVGGRNAFSYEIVPPMLNFPIKRFGFPFLQQTRDFTENNLYPFLYLAPDGNVFLFANNRAVLFNPQTAQVLHEYPVLEGGSRNYPPSASSALLPLKLNAQNQLINQAEVVICGGNKPEAFAAVDGKHAEHKVFLPALQDCHRIKILGKNPQWEKEQDMPSPRTMGDMLHLPTGELLLINGAKKGCSGWYDAEEPNFVPTVYMPTKRIGKRFKELNPTTIPRMYHASSAVLPSGKVLVAGSNPNEFYTFGIPYQTELRVEKFDPHYLDPKLKDKRPVLVDKLCEKVLAYGADFNIGFQLEDKKTTLGLADIKVTMLQPPFTTHGFSQNQRLLVLGIKEVTENQITAVAPPSGKIAPPGYYMIFVVHRGVPSKGYWARIA